MSTRFVGQRLRLCQWLLSTVLGRRTLVYTNDIQPSSDSWQDTIMIHDSQGQTGDADDIFYRLCTTNELDPKGLDVLLECVRRMDVPLREKHRCEDHGLWSIALG